MAAQTKTKLLDDALALPLDERAELVTELLESMEQESDIDVEAAWTEELERRASRIERGESQPVDWLVVREQARARLARG